MNDDRAVDFALFDLSGRPATFLNNKDATFAASAQQPSDLPPRALPGEARAFGDFNRDGAVDELNLKNGALAVLNRNERRPANWLTVRLEGYAAPGQVKSNRMGIGAKVEARSVGRWERRELRAGNGALGNFISDTISAGILGELVAPGKYWQPDPDEWVRITGSQLTPSRSS